MGAGSKEDLKAAVRAAMKEVLAELRPMPAAAGSVTEIIIRVGPMGAMKVTSGGQMALGDYDCPPPPCYQGAARPVLDDETTAKLQAIAQKTGETESQVLARIERENMSKVVSKAIAAEADSS